ncbi:glycerol-3-phosphate dehydrogenase/oxidase [Corynebacterium poyangense]|uniref:glycerol-3-phosphate dehydrogenase/oxidase n=1 Tax=Corynebacterium poyangense TaxID=2684405 RepID=UPI001CCD2A19|nr:glycerol-3-phosphate dehydrogenase/oxidase [Corynebacterium poyangense]
MYETISLESALNRNRREREISELSDSNNDIVDLVVIGGGITGVGVALDAASRGLKTVLFEKHDLAFGTSRWSSKLAHGGLRYLAKGEVSIAHHSAVERGILMERNAPHLVSSLPQVTALAADTNLLQKLAVRAGYLAGDVLRITAGTKSSTLPRSKFVSPRHALELCPQILRNRLRGAWVNFDGQMVDDARLVTAVARTAAENGASILTYCEVVEATGDCVKVRDRIKNVEFVVRARSVISAIGVWAQSLDSTIKVRPARGTHLVFDATLFGNPVGAMTVPLEGSISRYLFVLPEQHGRCYLGLTDEDNPGEIPDVPPTPEEDIDFLIRGINRALEVKIERKDVKAAFTGLRPLIESANGGGSTADLSRRHAILEAKDGLISITGGKFTEYRLMAEEVVDRAVKSRGLQASSCRTRNLPLVGAPNHPLYEHVQKEQLSGLPTCIVRRFGNEAPAVVSVAKIKRPCDLLDGVPDVTRAEISFAITHEGALTVDDILDRRTRIGLVAEDRVQVEEEISEIFNEVMQQM